MRSSLAKLLALAALLLPPTTAALAQSPMVLRDRLIVVHSNGTANAAALLTRSFTDRYSGVVEPTLRNLPNAMSLDLFCAGVGPQTPDIAIVARRMSRTMFETCQTNGVRDIVELQVGLSAVVLAVRRGEPVPSLTARQIWEALAAERLVEGEFVPNRQARWSQIGPGLPEQEINVIMPDRQYGVRGVFEDLVLEAGCRNVRGIRLLFEASYRREKCVTLREDGRVRSIQAVDVTAQLLASPPGTIGLMTYDQLQASGGNLVALPIDGVLPMASTIFNQDYGPTRSVVLYAKRQHTRSQQGVGVVRGIREFLGEVTSEAAFGPGGYLTNAGLVPLGPAERAQERRAAERMTITSR
jgi:phosphate transport system substrate-binding protein